MNKKFIYTVIIMMLTAVLLGACSNDETNLDDPTSSIEAYIHFLETYDEDDAIKAGIHPDDVDGSIERARANAEKVKQMSEEEQAGLLEILQNPEKIRELEIE